MKYLFSILSLLACTALAYENTTLNTTAGGGTSSGGSYQNTGSIVPVGGQTSQVGTLSHQSGFASGFILQPGTAFGALPDELNPDNDSDGLADGAEILAGSNLWKSDTDGDGLSDPDEVLTHGTDPTLPDTDSDGMDDAQELIAGTSPTNQTSILEVDCALLPDGRRQLSWFGVTGRSYTFQYTDSLNANEWQSYPFELNGSDSILSLTDSESATNRFYQVKVRSD